jgi:predicted unusual protein kinase regulating ubiquinone biosynthesis (AarF/ABC1/UbiB family)
MAIKEQKSIPTSKVQRAGKFISAGAKIGGNYLKHYSKKLVNPNMTKDELHEDNATDIYNSLSQLKGSALKVAQMLSMDKSLLPTAYQQQFALAQYSAPPLSYPLVVPLKNISRRSQVRCLIPLVSRHAMQLLWDKYMKRP